MALKGRCDKFLSSQNGLGIETKNDRDLIADYFCLASRYNLIDSKTMLAEKVSRYVTVKN